MREVFETRKLNDHCVSVLSGQSAPFSLTLIFPKIKEILLEKL